MARDDEALEHYQRNNVLEKACVDPYDRLASTFIEAYLVEALLGLIEKTQNRVKRRDAIACLEQLSALLAATRP
ncbi:MAG: hypothetical protein JRH20_21455 [Deltaproteobacteria bacterium]|nr:hypothetical protein [Deltaproteobacteria bacterium]